MTVPLPPLPPSFGDSDLAHDPGGRSVVDILAEEHGRIAALCRELTDAAGTPAHRGQTAQVLTATVARHLSGEEQYFYPTVRGALPDGARLADQEIAEDREVLRTLEQLQGAAPEDPEFDRLAEAVAAQLDRHRDVAARDLFPGLRGTLSTEDLKRLGNRVEIAEEAAPTRPHPDTPATPPWNKIVEPALGVVDKARDIIAGRPTSLDDLS
ncbi:hemerythrin domain-containing protein [Micromonospora sp. NPDC049679]|uniref:hemerythrin domain-containing protein n=1 Tax=Micromonospora sp. NPDC049679 TaxID=3155920 RepID=UPI0034109F1A